MHWGCSTFDIAPTRSSGKNARVCGSEKRGRERERERKQERKRKEKNREV